MFKSVRSTIKALLRRDRFEREMADEMRFHMSAYAKDLERAGVSRDEAERRARMEFGAVESLREECREAQGLHPFDELRQDVRYAVRQLARAPGFSAAIILSLALGIGANTAIFSLMDAVMFRMVPVADPQSLYYLAHRSDTDTSTSSNYPLLERYRSAEAFSGVTAYSTATFTVRTPEGLERVDGQFASGNYHALLGVPMTLGRGFSTEPDQPSGRPPIAVISDGYWKRKFGRRADVIGKSLTIGKRTVTIVGVTAPEFHGLVSGRQVDITLPISVRALDDPDFLHARDSWRSLALIGRLGPNDGEGRAVATIDGLFRRFWMEPENAWARDDERAAPRSAVLLPAGKGSASLRRQYSKPLGVLMAMVGVLLLIACANVANLLLARATARTKEIAVRLSIGAARARLVRQLLTESLIFAIVGGLLGVLVAIGSTGAILSAFAAGQSPTRFDVELNGRVLAFTLGVSAITGIVFGLVPAFRATRVDLARSLKEGGAAAGRRGRTAVGRILVVGQIALSVLVITAAGLLVQSLRNLRTFDAGFERNNILLFNLDAADTSSTPERRAAFYTELATRLRSLPGVADVSFSSRSPIDFSAQTRGVLVPGYQSDRRHGVSANVVLPGYFDLFGIRLLRGRAITEQDRAGAVRVAVVNEAMARFYFGSSDPIGRTLRFLTESEFATIVGVVADVRHENLREDAPSTVYTSIHQPAMELDGKRAMLDRVTVEIRTTSDPNALTTAVREQVRTVSPNANLWYVRSMQQQLDAALVRERLLASLSAGFGLLALLLAFVGLYGVMSYRTSRRVREIGIRMSLGATSGRVLRQVLRETLLTGASGIAIGLVAALATTKLVSAFLFGLAPRDPLMFTLVAVLLFATALVAGLLPARRAAKVEPMLALRAE